MAALLQPARFVDDPGFDGLQVRQHPVADHPPEVVFIPGTVGHKLLQALGGYAQPRRHGFDRLALAGHEQALHVAGGRGAPLAPAQGRD
jgi:hypothetical protein